MSRLTIFATAKYGTIPLATLRTARTVEAIKPARCGLINAIKLNGFFCFCMVSLLKLANPNQMPKKKADDSQDYPAHHRLCVLASGSDNMMFCPCTSTMCSLPHLGQNSGKRFRTVSGFTLVRVLLPQAGQ